MRVLSQKHYKLDKGELGLFNKYHALHETEAIARTANDVRGKGFLLLERKLENDSLGVFISHRLYVFSNRSSGGFGH